MAALLLAACAEEDSAPKLVLADQPYAMTIHDVHVVCKNKAGEVTEDSQPKPPRSNIKIDLLRRVDGLINVVHGQGWLPGTKLGVIEGIVQESNDFTHDADLPSGGASVSVTGTLNGDNLSLVLSGTYPRITDTCVVTVDLSGSAQAIKDQASVDGFYDVDAMVWSDGCATRASEATEAFRSDIDVVAYSDGSVDIMFASGTIRAQLDDLGDGNVMHNGDLEGLTTDILGNPQTVGLMGTVTGAITPERVDIEIGYRQAHEPEGCLHKIHAEGMRFIPTAGNFANDYSVQSNTEGGCGFEASENFGTVRIRDNQDGTYSFYDLLIFTLPITTIDGNEFNGTRGDLETDGHNVTVTGEVVDRRLRYQIKVRAQNAHSSGQCGLEITGEGIERYQNN